MNAMLIYRLCFNTMATLLSLWFSLVPLQGQTQEDSENLPRIIDILFQDGYVEVLAQIPEGFRQVYLEGKPRFGEGAWVPRAVLYTDGTAGEYRFTMRTSRDLEWLRIRAIAKTELAVEAYSGQSEFVAPEDGDDMLANALPSIDGAPEDAADANKQIENDDRDVVESDIWSVRDDRVYFFNQYRGLQVIDIADPAHPQLIGERIMPASGEQMYVLDSAYVALLARNSCGWWSGDAENRLVILDVTGEQPEVAATVGVRGYIQESRLVGQALYVSSQVYEQKAGPRGETFWEWGSMVTSYDLKDPSAPILKDQIWVPGYGNVIHATSQYLLAVTQGEGNNGWWRSMIRLIDISQPDGSMKELSTIQPAGRVNDKFKMSVEDNVLRVISEKRDSTLITQLETFDLTVPQKPNRLGEVQLGKGESLYATRFDGDKAYIVTFLRVDPLWVVDLSDPTQPLIAGELEVPGWSTYIQPLGDRLLSIGIDNVDGWRVAVSLFDVSDPSEPGLLSRVPIGSHHSWSEANSDEKAFGWLEQEGLILVPFQSYDESQSTKAVQLIELEGDALMKRGLIEHEVQPRRSTMVGESILSLSGKSLLSVDASDRDVPRVQSELMLSWKVDEVFSVGSHLIELDRGDAWTRTGGALRIVDASDESQTLALIDLDDGPVVGATIRDHQLIILQGLGMGSAIVEAEPVDGSNQKAHLKVFDLTQLPKLPLSSEVSIQLQNPLPSGQLSPMWVGDRLLVWQASQGNWYGWWGRGVVDIAGDVLWPGPNNWGGSRLLAFSIPQDEPTQFLSDFELSLDSVWDFSQAFAADGKVFLSYQTMMDGEQLILKRPGLSWVRKSFLSVIDYADPKHPTARPPVSIPGQLQGISHNGHVIYTMGQHYQEDTLMSDGKEWLDVLAYDGVAARLSDSRAFVDLWPHQVQVDSTGILTAQQLADASLNQGDTQIPPMASLSQWTVDARGKLQQRGGRWLLPSGSYQMVAVDGDTLLRMGNDIWHFGSSDSQALEHLATYTPEGCQSLDLKGAVLMEDGSLLAPGGNYGAFALLPQDTGESMIRFSSGIILEDEAGFPVQSLHVEQNLTTFHASHPNQLLPPYRELSWDPLSWDSLEDLLDWEAFVALADVVECVDCKGQSREWIEVHRANSSHRIEFPLGALIESIGPFQKQIRSLREAFKVPQPRVDSFRFYDSQADCENWCRRDMTISSTNLQFRFTDPSGQQKPLSGSQPVDKGLWMDLLDQVDWPSILNHHIPWDAYCYDCEGYGWIEIRVSGQNYWVDKDAQGIEGLVRLLNQQVEALMPTSEDEGKVVSVAYLEDKGRCVGYCVQELQVDELGTYFTARSPDGSLPALESKQPTLPDQWDYLNQQLLDLPWDEWGPELGCPGCSDKGLARLSVSVDGTLRQVAFDLLSPPDALHEVVNLLQEMMVLAGEGVIPIQKAD